MSGWLTLSEFSHKYRISVSTLRRRLKDGSLIGKLENGKYLIEDQRPNDEVQVAREIAELHASYGLLLRDRDRQIYSLKTEVVELKTLVKALEAEIKIKRPSERPYEL